MSDPYSLLGVSRNADDSEIKKAFRKRSLDLHPDRNQDKDTTSEFQALNAAYDKIKTSELRQKHEMESQFGSGGIPFGQAPGMDGFQDINNIFNMMFGGGMQGMGPGVRIFHGGMPGMHPGMHPGTHPGMPGQPFFHQQMQKPPPIVKTCEITMEQCFNGCTLPIDIERRVTDNGVIGKRIETIHINIPPGIDENEIIVLRDLGNSSIDGQLKGDIKLSVSVKPHPVFERHGFDILYKKTLSLKEALCGFVFEIPHLSGKTLAINNTANVTVVTPNFRRIVPQMGIRRDAMVGNLIIEFQVDFPTSLTAEQIDSLKEIL